MDKAQRDKRLARIRNRGAGAYLYHESDLAWLLYELDREIEAYSELSGAYRERLAEYAELRADFDRINVKYAAAQLRSIEARNPGIDMEEVRAIRNRQSEEKEGTTMDDRQTKRELIDTLVRVTRERDELEAAYTKLREEMKGEPQTRDEDILRAAAELFHLTVGGGEDVKAEKVE